MSTKARQTTNPIRIIVDKILQQKRDIPGKPPRPTMTPPASTHPFVLLLPPNPTSPTLSTTFHSLPHHVADRQATPQPITR